MKVSKYIVFPLTYAVFLLLLSNEAQAKAPASQKIEDMTQWTQDQVYAYFDKYNIPYDKKDTSLLDTATKYRDAAIANTNIFITDKVDGITRLTDDIKTKLEKEYHVAANNVDSLITDLTHEFRQLELSGHLTEDQVKQVLDRYHKKAIKQKYVTEAQWKSISNDIRHSFAHSTWYQRVFHTEPTADSYYFNNDAFHNWVTNTVTSRLEENKAFTRKQIDAIGDTLQNAIQATSASLKDLSQLGTKPWWQQFAKDVETHAEIQKDQVQVVVDALSQDINSYKIFAMNYAGEAVDGTQSFLAAATQYILEKGNDIYQAVVHPLKSDSEKVSSALYTASSAAAAATDSAASSASSLRAQVTQTVNEYKDYVVGSASDAKEYVVDSASEFMDDSKNSFGKFWRQKELETYRRMGYTQAHIDWMENYLSKEIHDKSNLAKDSVHNILSTIRNYLMEAKVQTVSNIDSQMKALESMIDNWRRNHDEL